MSNPTDKITAIADEYFNAINSQIDELEAEIIRAELSDDLIEE